MLLEEKTFRPGVRWEVVVRNPKAYIDLVKLETDLATQIAKTQNDNLIVRWCLAAMTLCILAFLVTWFLFGTGRLPFLSIEMIKWFGDGTIGVLAIATGTICAARFKRTD